MWLIEGLPAPGRPVNDAHTPIGCAGRVCAPPGRPPPQLNQSLRRVRGRGRFDTRAGKPEGRARGWGRGWEARMRRVVRGKRLGRKGA